MGWCSGSHLADEVAEAVMPFLASELRPVIAELLIDKFSDHDADCWDEIGQPDLKAAWRKICKQRGWLEDDE